MQKTVSKIASCIMNGGMDPDKFPTVVDAFGRLPVRGQLGLAMRLVGAVNLYRLRIRVKKRRPAEERAKLARIAASSKSLLKELDIQDAQALGRDPNKAHPYSLAGLLLLTELYKVAEQRRPSSKMLSAHERWTTLLLLLSDLQEAAKRASDSLSSLHGKDRVGKGRGGKTRQGPDAKGELLNSLFEAYAESRRRFPTNGRALACDETLRQFVRAALSLAATSAPPFGVTRDGRSLKLYELANKASGPDLSKPSRTTKEAIRKAFERWRGPPVCLGEYLLRSSKHEERTDEHQA
jgi:hypothetical protein